MYMSRCGHNAMTTTTQNFSRKEITLSQQSRECIIIGKNFFQIDLTIKLIKYSHHHQRQPFFSKMKIQVRGI